MCKQKSTFEEEKHMYKFFINKKESWKLFVLQRFDHKHGSDNGLVELNNV